MTPVWLTAPQFASDPGPILEAARFCEEAEISGLCFFDHLVPLFAPRRPIIELAAVLGWAAAVTSSLRLASLVLRASLRGPEISAAIAKTAAAIAPGRFVLGLGAGDRLFDEADRFGLPSDDIDQRLAQLEETIDRVAGGGFPVWVGGLHHRVQTVAAERADGWNGWGIDPNRLAGLTSSLRARAPNLRITWGGAVMIGRDQTEVEKMLADRGGGEGVLAGTPDQVREGLARLVEAGADELIVAAVPNRLERWELLASHVIPRL